MTEDTTPRWTEIEHLPQWDEEFYQVYTAKKFGKWVMIKTLRPEYADKPEYQAMIEKEFDVRYNLAHPNVVMINDFEDIPGIGRCIVTDDVYGKSLRTIIDNGELTQHHLDQICHQLVNALAYIQTNHIVHHPIRPETIIFTENIENLKLIDVGFDQRSKLKPSDVADDIYSYGIVLREVLDKLHVTDLRLRAVAKRCTNPDPRRRYKTVEHLREAIEGRSAVRLYLVVIAFLLLMIAVLIVMQVYIK